MKKRTLALFLALVMCLVLLPAAALAAEAPHDVDPCIYDATIYGDRLVSDSKLTINGVIGTELSGPDQFDDSVIFDVVVGGGYTLDMSYPAGRSRYYNTYVDMALLNGEPVDDPAAGRLQQSAGWFDENNPQSRYVLTCTEDMVSTPGVERLYHFWLDWGDSPVASEYTEKDGNVNFWLRVHPASAASTVPATATAIPTTQKLLVNGKEQIPAAYNIDGSNYFKIRDVAAMLIGTEKEFGVDYDDTTRAVTIFPRQKYEKKPTDLQGRPTASGTAMKTNDVFYCDGEQAPLGVYKINNTNYIMLRDLAKLLDFCVEYDEATRSMIIDTTKPYTE